MRKQLGVEGRLGRRAGVLVAALAVVGCGSESEPPSSSGAGGSGGSNSASGGAGGACAEGEVRLGGECQLDPFRYEPEEQLDQDNVRYYSEQDLELLELPPPPKSGFRIIMEPQYVDPGGDVYPCQAWEIPELENEYVYTAVLHTTPGLHHANLYGVDPDPERGNNPYPGCWQRADGQVFGQIGDVFTGAPLADINAPDVLFANSTQVVGSESYALPPGYAYRITAGKEVTTDVHLQNTTGERLRVEAAWDFYTMPKELVTNEVAMFVNVWLDFKIPARSKHTLTTQCGWDGGEVVAVMPHMHQWGVGFDVSYGQAELYTEGTLADNPKVAPLDSVMATPYDEQDIEGGESAIQVYYPTVNTDGTNAVQFQCHFNNDTPNDMCNGFANHEMCFLFGYVSPPTKQRVGVVPTEGAPCLSFNPHTVGPDETVDLVEYWSQSPPEVQPKLLSMLQGGFGSFFGGCRE